MFLGQVGERKGTFTLLDAWAKMLANGETPALLTVAGDGEVERAHARVAELGLSESVQVLGWVAPAETGRLLNQSQVLVLPSLNEGQPMAILEAMARGLCVVATDTGDIPDLIGDDCGVLVPIGDVATLAQSLTDVVRDSHTRIRLGTNAMQRIRDQFDADVIWKRFDAIYRQVGR